MGGKNPFMGIAYVVVGGVCVLLGALFTIAHLVRPRYVPIPLYVWCRPILIPSLENWVITPIYLGIQLISQPLPWPLGETTDCAQVPKC